MEEQRIHYKYDIMHRSTPRFAECTITWDTRKLTPITRNRVIRAYRQPNTLIGWGDAGKLVRALNEKFQVPMCNIHTSKHKDWKETNVRSDILTEGMRAEINKLMASEIAQHRLEGRQYWGQTEIGADFTRVHQSFYKEHDFTALIEEMKKARETEEFKRACKNAIEFVQDGGLLIFKYTPN